MKQVEAALQRNRVAKERYGSRWHGWRPPSAAELRQHDRLGTTSGDLGADGGVRLIRMLKPQRLRSGDRIAIVAPASPFAREEFDKGVAELAQLGFEPVFEESVFARHAGYLSGEGTVRAQAFLRAWTDPSVKALIAVRGGYGSIHLLPHFARRGSAPDAEGLHRIQRSDNGADVSHDVVRHRVVPRPDARPPACRAASPRTIAVHSCAH